MSGRKTNFVLPKDCLEYLADFTDEEAGELFRAILTYANSQEETEFSDRAMKMYFKRIKKYIDNANENYEKVLVANRKNGAKGGRPKNETEKTDGFSEETEKTDGFFEKPKKADTESESDTESDTESVIRESVREKTPPRKEKHGENSKVELTDYEFLIQERKATSKREKKASHSMAELSKRRGSGEKAKRKQRETKPEKTEKSD